MKTKGTFKYRNENVHYEVDSDKGYWRQWFDCKDRKAFSIKDILIFSKDQMNDRLKCCDFHLQISSEVEPILWAMAEEM